MEAGLPSPILGSGVVVELTTVGAVGFVDVKSFEGAVFIDEDGVFLIDRYCRWTQCLMCKAFVVEIGDSRGETVCPGQEDVAALVFLKRLESLWWFLEEHLQVHLRRRCEQDEIEIILRVGCPDRDKMSVL